MPRKPQPQIKAWSYSRYFDYSTCPFKAKLKYVDRIKEPGSPAMERGSKIHKLAEEYTIGKIPVNSLPKELGLFEDEFRALRKRAKSRAKNSTFAVEQQWGFTDKWVPTGWFGYDTWCRVVLDVVYYDHRSKTVTVIDHKTGKVRDNHKEQLSLYVLAALIKFPEATTVIAQMWYLDQGEIMSVNYTRDEYEGLIEKWNRLTLPMLSDREFLPTANYLCGWCFFSKAKNGPCKF